MSFENNPPNIDVSPDAAEFDSPKTLSHPDILDSDGTALALPVPETHTLPPSIPEQQITETDATEPVEEQAPVEPPRAQNAFFKPYVPRQHGYKPLIKGELLSPDQEARRENIKTAEYELKIARERAYEYIQKHPALGQRKAKKAVEETLKKEIQELYGTKHFSQSNRFDGDMFSRIEFEAMSNKLRIVQAEIKKLETDLTNDGTFTALNKLIGKITIAEDKLAQLKN